MTYPPAGEQDPNRHLEPPAPPEWSAPSEANTAHQPLPEPVNNNYTSSPPPRMENSSPYNPAGEQQPMQAYGPPPTTPGNPQQADNQAPYNPAGDSGNPFGPPPGPPGFLSNEAPQKTKSKAGILVGMLIFVLLVATGVTLYFIGVIPSGSDNKPQDPITPAPTSAAPSDETKPTTSEEPTTESVPSNTVDAYYKAFENKDRDALLATMSDKLLAQYEKEDATDEDWQALWELGNNTTYEIIDETITDNTATVTVAQTTDGTETTITVDLVLENNEWKIEHFG